MIHHSNSVPGSNARGKEKKYHGNYLGIVIQNNDPDQRGRIKVYIPHINPSVWINWDSKVKDKTFKFIGKNIDSDLTPIIDELKQVIPWANCAAPLVGAGSSGTYNAHDKTATISDSSKPEHRIPSNITSKYKLNTEGIGEKPARLYEVDEIKLSDAFTTTEGLSAPGKINKLGSQYKPTSYSNSPKGSFSIPNVGSHVWVFFAGGDLNVPVYFASSFGKTDWQLINDDLDNTGGIDYPGSYENISTSDDKTYDHNTETYRNKYVMHPNKGGVVEFVGTDTREILKLTHFSGSFKEFNNEATIELATGNDQSLILGNKYSTIRGHDNLFVDRDREELIRGDLIRKIGTFNKAAFDEWETEVEKFANIKALFETKRTKYTENIIIQSQSTAEKGESGTRAVCPLCKGDGKMYKVNSVGPTNITDAVSIIGKTPLIKKYVTASDCKERFDFVNIKGDANNFLGSGACPVCNGSGISPSTYGGEFDSNEKDRLINEKIKTMISDLALIEKKLGEGGSEIVNITKHKVETIGLTFNKFPSIRMDNVGKIVHNEMKIFKEGVLPSYATAPVIEYVHVDDMPGGTYSLNVCNRYNVQVGAGGLSLKSYGSVDIGGAITNIGGEQVNILSDNEINITGGKRVSIRSEILTLRQSKGGQVLIDGNLGVKNNVIIGGGLHVEGEVTCHHITAPLEVHETHLTKAYGQLVNGMLIGKCQIRGSHGADGDWPVYAKSTPMTLHTYEHSHTYNSIPMTFTQNSDDVREFAQRLERDEPADPVPACSDIKGKGFNDIGESI